MAVSDNSTVSITANATLGALMNTNPAVGHTGGVTSVVTTSGGLAVTGGQDGRVFVWNISSSTPALPVRMLFIAATGVVNTLAVVPASPHFGRELVAAGYIDSVVRLWDAATGVLVRSLPRATGAGVYSLAVTLEGSIAAGYGDGMVVLWNAATQLSTNYALQVRACCC